MKDIILDLLKDIIYEKKKYLTVMLEFTSGAEMHVEVHSSVHFA